jgi:adenylosuccinate lyase
MQKNIDQLDGLIFSQQVLLALTQAGMSREGAYKAVQQNAMEVWRSDKTFLDHLKNDKNITKYLSIGALQDLFSMETHTKHVDTIFKRIFGK